MKQLLISVLLLLTCTIHAQQNKIVDATDGTIDAYVGITWILSSPVIRYEIVRSETDDLLKGRVVHTDTTQMELFGDRDAVRGVKYIYKVKSYKTSGEVVDIGFDIGWRPLPPPIAIKQVRYDAELYASSPKVQLVDSVVVAQPEIRGKWKSNQTVGIKTVLRYIGGAELDNVVLKVFISNDKLLDETDELVNEIALEKGLNTNITELDETINLPKRNYKNKNLIIAVIHGQETKAITVKPL